MFPAASCYSLCVSCTTSCWQHFLLSWGELTFPSSSTLPPFGWPSACWGQLVKVPLPLAKWRWLTHLQVFAVLPGHVDISWKERMRGWWWHESKPFQRVLAMWFPLMSMGMVQLKTQAPPGNVGVNNLKLTLSYRKTMKYTLSSCVRDEWPGTSHLVLCFTLTLVCFVIILNSWKCVHTVCCSIVAQKGLLHRSVRTLVTIHKYIDVISTAHSGPLPEEELQDLA